MVVIEPALLCSVTTYSDTQFSSLPTLHNLKMSNVCIVVTQPVYVEAWKMSNL